MSEIIDIKVFLSVDDNEPSRRMIKFNLLCLQIIIRLLYSAFMQDNKLNLSGQKQFSKAFVNI